MAMKFVLALCLVVVSAAVVLAAEPSFIEWVATHNKVYTAEEFSSRAAIYYENVRVIEEHNAQNLTSYTLGVNAFTDLTWAEFSAQVLMAPQHCSATQGNHVNRGVDGRADPSIDWRLKNVVTPVKNQGSCGSCWAFGTTGAVESHWALSTGKLLALSEQQLVDCAGAFSNMGCNGGLPSQAFEYIKHAGGIELGTDYVYTGRDGACRFNLAKVVAQVTGEVNITEGVESELFDAVTNAGPVSIAFQVVSDFQSYRSGVYDSTKCKSGPLDVNHAVLVVGYNTDAASSKPYWIVKNSWGQSWGIAGYFNMVRNKNMCGISTCASYPLTK